MDRVTICADHAKALAEGVERRGLAHLATKLGGTRAPDFDPLATAETVVWLRAFELWGLRSIMANPEGTQRCPLCEASRREGRGAGSKWIGWTLDAVVAYARAHGHEPRRLRLIA